MWNGHILLIFYECRFSGIWSCPLAHKLAVRLLPDVWQHYNTSAGILCISHTSCGLGLFWFVLFVTISYLKKDTWFIYPYSMRWLHWHWCNHMIAPVPMKQPHRIWVNQLVANPKTKQQNAKQVPNSKGVLEEFCSEMQYSYNISRVYFEWVDDVNDHIKLYFSKLHITHPGHINPDTKPIASCYSSL